MTEEQLVEVAGPAVRELSSAIVDELATLRNEVQTESAALEAFEADALRATVSAAKIWLRIRLGRDIAAAEIARKVGV